MHRVAPAAAHPKPSTRARIVALAGSRRAPTRRWRAAGSGNANLRPFLELVSFYAGYSFDEADWLAVEAGLEALASEMETFDYPIIGRLQLGVSLSTDPNSGYEISVKITGRPDRLLGARISGLIDPYQHPDRSLPG
jgi:hypothetical protein